MRRRREWRLVRVLASEQERRRLESCALLLIQAAMVPLRCSLGGKANRAELRKMTVSIGGFRRVEMAIIPIPDSYPNPYPTRN